VTITTMRSGVVRVEDSEESLYASVDLVADKITRKLQKVRSPLLVGVSFKRGYLCASARVPPRVPFNLVMFSCLLSPQSGFPAAPQASPTEHTLQQAPNQACMASRLPPRLLATCTLLLAFARAQVHHNPSHTRVLLLVAICCPCQVKERLISQGAWPGSGGPRVNTDEQDFKVRLGGGAECAAGWWWGCCRRMQGEGRQEGFSHCGQTRCMRLWV
jgi:hypothetical protein